MTWYLNLWRESFTDDCGWRRRLLSRLTLLCLHALSSVAVGLIAAAFR